MHKHFKLLRLFPFTLSLSFTLLSSSSIPEIPPGYPYPPLTTPFASHYPYLLQPAAAADADGLAPDVPLPAETSEHLAVVATTDVKPRHLCSPVVVEPLQASRELEAAERRSASPKQEPELEDCKEGLSHEGLAALSRSGLAPQAICMEDATGPADLEVQDRVAVLPRLEDRMDSTEDGGTIKVEVASSSSYGCVQPYLIPDVPVPVLDSRPKMEVPERYISLTDSAFQPLVGPPEACPQESEMVYPSEQAVPTPEQLGVACELREPVPVCASAPASPDEPLQSDNLFPTHTSPPPLHLALPLACSPAVTILSEDPMAGLFALVAASELPQAGSLFVPAECSAIVTPLESSALEGIALLSQLAELEMEKCQDDAALRKSPIASATRSRMGSLWDQWGF